MLAETPDEVAEALHMQAEENAAKKLEEDEFRWAAAINQPERYAPRSGQLQGMTLEARRKLAAQGITVEGPM